MPPLIQFDQSPIRARRRRPRTLFAGRPVVKPAPRVFVIDSAVARYFGAGLSADEDVVTRWSNAMSQAGLYDLTTVVGAPRLTMVYGRKAASFPHEDSLQAVAGAPVRGGLSILCVCHRLENGRNENVAEVSVGGFWTALRMRENDRLSVYSAGWLDGPELTSGLRTFGLVANGASSVLAVGSERVRVGLPTVANGVAETVVGNVTPPSKAYGCKSPILDFVLFDRALTDGELTEAITRLEEFYR